MLLANQPIAQHKFENYAGSGKQIDALKNIVEAFFSHHTIFSAKSYNSSSWLYINLIFPLSNDRLINIRPKFERSFECLVIAELTQH
jgi:hypothetical protein